MVYAKQNASFRHDKQQFFAQVKLVNQSESNFQSIENQAAKVNYSFLLNNQKQLESEFMDMFSELQKKDSKNKEIFWFYCYYCATLLETFYKAYSQQNKEAQYTQFKLQIKAHLQKSKQKKDVDEGFIQSLSRQLINDFNSLLHTPMHLSQIRDKVAYVNLCRLYWVFTRLTLTQGLKLARDLKLIEKLDVILGTHTDVDKIISAFQAPAAVINVCSVGLFLARFLIDAGLLIRHTFFPTELEKGAAKSCAIQQMIHLPGAASIERYRNSYIVIPDEDNDHFILYYIPREGVAKKLRINNKKQFSKDLQEKFIKKLSFQMNEEEINTLITAQTGHVPETTTCLERFKHELYKRHCNFANDLVWATVNFLTNFNQISKIPGPITGYITAAFLTFDVALIMYRSHLAEQEYLVKKSQYLQEIAEYNNPLRFISIANEQRLLHIDMLNKQMMALEIDWKTKEATYYFVAAAAALLFMGFTASLLLSPPMLVLASYFVCLIGVAMYMSSDAYSHYKKKALHLEEGELIGKNLAVAQKEFETARKEFMFTMAKNIAMPAILITTYAICWPAAIVLTVLYLGYEMFHAYQQHVNKKSAEQLALAGPECEGEMPDFLLMPGS